jgi:methionyl-tRNA formyltransferase
MLVMRQDDRWLWLKALVDAREASEEAGVFRGESLRCSIIGRGGLLIECAELLLEQGHTIAGIISNNPHVRAWSAQHRICCVDTIDELPPDAALSEVDYLFSIANGYIFSDAELQLPRRGAINYHNAPLPRYAGVHATSWAILNNETSYGVTWHLMAARIDAGAILKQVIFPIDPDETTLTLNLKCYDHAFEAFGELVGELASGTLSRPGRIFPSARTSPIRASRPAARW